MRFAQEISIFNPYAIADALIDMGTTITQTAEEIRLEAAATYATQTGLQTLSSRVSQTATAISFTLSKNGDRTAQLSMSYTKEDGSVIQLAAQSVQFTGLVTFTDLSGTGTTINGGNITTGTLSGDRINGGTITGSTISGGTLIAQGTAAGDVVIGNGQVHVPYLRFVKDGNDIGGILTDFTWDDNPSGKRLWTGHGLHVTAEEDEWFTCDTSARFTGNVYNSSGYVQFVSDRRKKNDIEVLKDGYNTIMNLVPVSFRLKEHPETKHHGFIAQMVQEIVKDDWGIVGEMPEGDSTTLTLSYTELIADLVGAVQTLDKRINQFDCLDTLGEIVELVHKQNERIAKLEAQHG